MNQVVIMESKIEVLGKQVDALKCCGNCKNNHITNIDTYCEITGEEVKRMGC
jgi:hypothetical protein